MKPVIHGPFEPMHVRAWRHPNMYDVPPSDLKCIWRQVERRIHLLRITRDIHNVPHDRLHLAVRNANDFPIIGNTKKHIAAETIQESANRLKGVLLGAIPAAFELNADVLTALLKLMKIDRSHVSFD